MPFWFTLTLTLHSDLIFTVFFCTWSIASILQITFLIFSCFHLHRHWQVKGLEYLEITQIQNLHHKRHISNFFKQCRSRSAGFIKIHIAFHIHAKVMLLFELFDGLEIKSLYSVNNP